MYRLQWETESGDEGEYFFKEKLTKKQQELFIRDNHPDEFEMDGDEEGETEYTYINWRFDEIEFSEFDLD